MIRDIAGRLAMLAYVLACAGMLGCATLSRQQQRNAQEKAVLDTWDKYDRDHPLR